MIWQGGRIEESKEKYNFLGNGLYKWKYIKELSKDYKSELTHTWWMVRRFTAWAGKVPDKHLPPIEGNSITEKEKRLIEKNVIYHGSLIENFKNI
jgi:hypothetical protein